MPAPARDAAPQPREPGSAVPRPPGQHHIVDPAEVSQVPVVGLRPREVSDAEGELLVTDAAGAPPVWASSRLIAACVALILIAILLGIGIWVGNWLLGDGAHLFGG